MRRTYAFLVVLLGCDDRGAQFDFADFGIPQTPQLETSAPTAENESLYAPDAATLPVGRPLSPADCADAVQFQSIFGACPTQPPEIESCTLEGLTCLYPTAPVADAGAQAQTCYAVFGCSFGLWSPLGERCPGPWEFNPGPAVVPPLASTPPSPSVPTTPAPTMSVPSVPPVMSSVPVSSVGVGDAGAPLPPPADAGTLGEAGASSDAGAPAHVGDASLVQDASSSFLPSAVGADAGTDAGSTAAPPVDAAPVLDAALWDGRAPDAGLASTPRDASSPFIHDAGSSEPVNMDPTLDQTHCPKLSPVPGSECSGSDVCGYGFCANREAALILQCACGHWIQTQGSCSAEVGR